MASWEVRTVAVVVLLILLFGVFAADVFGPEDFSAVAYIAPILVAIGGLAADVIIRSNGNKGRPKRRDRNGDDPA